ncbi:hypothetical protein KM043_018403 [Ampulex compressa]|nr:hypothetical protein KM043_018403 [Ampulex compressa]
MLPRRLVLLLWVLPCLCYAQQTGEATTTEITPESNTFDGVLIIGVITCTTIPVLLTLVSTILYYKYVGKDAVQAN